jgi:Mg-chelatase subunit ChlD
MKNLLTTIVFWFLALSLNAQENLVNNPSFENGTFTNRGAFKLKQGKRGVDYWGSPRSDAAYLFNMPRKSVAVANTGSKSVGLTLGSSKQEKTKFKYITGKLKAPLEKGKAYCICFSTLLHRSSKWAATNVGLLLHRDADLVKDIHDPTSLTASLYANAGEAVVNTKWKQYCGYYVASGGELYISFGKFGNSASVKMKDLGLEPYYEMEYQNEAFYQFDDISVLPLSEDTDCGCATEPPLPEEDTTVQPPAHPPYLFALDASGSMKKEGLFDSLRQNLTRFVKELPDGTPVSFVTFASSSRKVFAGEVKTSTAATVDSLLSRAPVGGGTNVFLGLQMAYESWDTGSPDSAKMILISDGEFHVSPKIVSIIKNEFETKGRKLTLIQIGARASGLEQVKPYMDDYIYTNPSELSQAVAQLHKPVGGGLGETAYDCGCEEEYSDTLNYHFVIDYSGSMAQEKKRAVMAVRYLFERAPDNAMISVTSFNTSANQLYVGKKSGITMARLSMLLARGTGGGTNPVPGVQHALKLAKRMSAGHFSHVILITDYSAVRLSMLKDLGAEMKASMREFDLAGSAIEVSQEGFVTTYSQFDETSSKYVGIGRVKFEKDLFYTQRSSCNFTSQPYHYNPAKAVAGNGGKKFLAGLLKGLANGLLSN